MSIWARADASSARRAVRSAATADRKSTRLNSSHGYISYAVFCLKKKNHCHRRRLRRSNLRRAERRVRLEHAPQEDQQPPGQRDDRELAPRPAAASELRDARLGPV